MTNEETQRLQKVMAEAGVASRRACEQIILDGRVRVNGRVVKELGTQVIPGRDRVEVDGKAVLSEPTVMLILNKPRGVVCTASDPEGRETVIDLVKGYRARLFPVGRLDYNTSGALLMTNDGDLAFALTHPKFGAEKTYLIKIHGRISESVLEQWRKGITLDDNTSTRPAKEVFKVEESAGFTWLQVTIKEGKNRQIRRMAEATGLRISKLKRIAFAGITIEKLPIGTWRELTEHELYKLKRDYATPVRKAGVKGQPGDYTEDDEDTVASPRKTRVKRGWGGSSEPEGKVSAVSPGTTGRDKQRPHSPSRRPATPAGRTPSGARRAPGSPPGRTSRERPAAPSNRTSRETPDAPPSRTSRERPAAPSSRTSRENSRKPTGNSRPKSSRKDAPKPTGTTPRHTPRRGRGRP